MGYNADTDKTVVWVDIASTIETVAAAEAWGNGTLFICIDTGDVYVKNSIGELAKFGG